MRKITPDGSDLTGRQHQAVLPAIIHGTVTKIGYYQDTLPKLIIKMKKDGSMVLPFLDGERVPVPFVINSQTFTAGIRSTPRSATVSISPDLNDSTNNPVRLADILYELGWDERTTKIALRYEAGVIICDLRHRN